jgi:hypothetical protein
MKRIPRTTGGTMNSQPQGFEELRDRVLKLEKQNRRFKQLGVATLIVPALLLVMGQAPSKKSVEANEFILRDDSGNVRATLSMNAALARPELVLRDEQGKARVDLVGSSLKSAPVGGGIRILNSEGLPIGQLAAGNDGTARLMLIDTIQKTLTTLDAGNWLTVDAANSTVRLEPGHLELLDASGFKATLGTEKLITQDTGETHQTSAASLVMFDKNKNVIWKAP